MLDDMASKHRLTPDNLILDARADPQHPCHGKFNWNVEEAAWAHWRQVARTIIGSYTIRHVSDERVSVQLSYYVHDPRQPNVQAYVSLNDLKRDRDLAREFLLHEGRLLSGRFLTWISYAEELQMSQPLRDLQTQLQKFLDEIEGIPR